MSALEKDLSGTLDAALEIAAARAQSLRQLRDALESNDDALALSIARKVCGLNDETGNRTTPRQYSGPSRIR